MSERDWIERYLRPLAKSLGSAGLHDDVAQLSLTSSTLVNMDTLVEGVHFLPTDPMNTVGQKLVRVNLSDIYAKGASPSEALLSIAWPEGKTEAAFSEFINGLASDLSEFEIDLIGGDFVATPGPLVVTLTLTGECLAEKPVRRRGKIESGDRVWLSGEIGWGGIGLLAAQEGRQDEIAQAYRVPKVSSLEQAKAVSLYAKASIDISDGLLIDALALAKVNNVALTLGLDDVPFAVPPKEVGLAIEQASAGDDYQILCLTSPNQDLSSAGFYHIGQVVSGDGLNLKWRDQTVPLPLKLGFSH